MVAYLDRVAEHLVVQSWQIAVLVAAVALVSWLMRDRSAHIRYLLWLIVLAKCLVPPAVEVPVAVLPPPEPPVVREVFPAAPGEAAVEGLSQAADERRVASVSDAASVSPSLSSRQWLAVVWMAGAAAFVLIALVRTARTMVWLRTSRQPPSEYLQAPIDTLMCSSDVKYRPKIWLIAGTAQPFVWGLVRGAVYLPQHFDRLGDREQQRAILGHELSHILRFDAAINALQIVAQALFWFHPFVWWANLRIRREREKCCDEMAVARFGANVKSYSTAIIDTLAQSWQSSRPVPSLAVAGSLKHIEERIRTMMTPGRRFYKHPSLVAATATLLLALLIVPTALVLTSRAQTQPATGTQKKPSTALHEAVKAGDLAEVKRLIGQGADVTTPANSETLTPLGEAAHKGHAEIAKVLLESGADVENAADYFTPLFYAIWSGDPDTVRTLIAAGANVNVLPNENDVPPLIYSLWEKKVDIITILLDAGADLDSRTGAALNVSGEGGFRPLYWAAVSSSREVFNLILSRGDYGDTIHMAACRGDLQRVKAFVQEGLGVDARDEGGCTPLHWAAYGDSSAVADYLIAEGGDINAKDNFGRVPLMWAHGLAMVKLFVAKGADLHAMCEQNGLTKLHEACIGGDKDIVDLLLSQGEDVNQRARNGSTPLVLAAASGHVDVVEFLIAKGADVSVTGPEGRTIVDVAKQGKHSDVVNVLRKHGVRETLYGAAISGAIDDVKRLIAEGADVNIRNRAGGTPLHLAAQRGRAPHREVAELLIRAGADVNARDNDGKTPLALTLEGNHTEMAASLRAHGAKE